MKKIKIHHIGFVVKDIDFFEKNLIYTEIINKVYDPIQKAKLALYLVDQKDSSMIELIQPIDEKSLTFNFLKNNRNNFHHICYQIDSFKYLKYFENNYRLIKVFGPVKSILFDRNVVFYFNRNKQIVEFVEK